MLCDTYQAVDLESKEGKTFLRRVMRDCDWTVRASAATEWNLEFSRTIKGKSIGDAETAVTVRTNAKVSVSRCKTGMVQSFHDSTPVRMVSVSSLFLWNSDSAVIAKLLLDGSQLSVIASSGSTHSSHHNLSFYYLEASVSGCAYGAVSIGSQTVAKDGETLISGAVSIR